MYEEERNRQLILENEKEEKFWNSIIDEMADGPELDSIIEKRIEEYENNHDKYKMGHDYPEVDYKDLEPFDESQSYEDYLKGITIDEFTQSEEFDEIIREFEIEEKYFNNLIDQYLNSDFFNNAAKEAIQEEEYLQDYVDRMIYGYDNYPEDNPEDNYYDYGEEDRGPFDSLGDMSYMDMGIFEGGDMDHLEEPPRFDYNEPEIFFDDFEVGYDESEEYEYDLEEPVPEIENDEERLEMLISEKLDEEKLLEKAFRQSMKKEDRIEKIIMDKMAHDIKLNTKIKRHLAER